MNIWLTVRTFIAFYFVLFGVAYMAGAGQWRAIVGAFFAALGVTFLWRLWVAIRAQI